MSIREFLNMRKGFFLGIIFAGLPLAGLGYQFNIQPVLWFGLGILSIAATSMILATRVQQSSSDHEAKKSSIENC